MGFLEDLKRGEAGQEQAQQVILNNLSHLSPVFTTVMASGLFKSWDIEMRLTAECKLDEMSAKYNNFAFEEKSLEHTKSDIWVHIIYNGTYIFQTEKLKEDIQTHIKHCKIKPGGDQGHKLYIYPIEYVKNNFNILYIEEKK